MRNGSNCPVLCPVLGLVAALLGGCAQEPPVQPVNITASDYCAIAQKVTWSVDDTRETISGVRREAAKWDRRCGRAKPTS
jgi:type IV pilus biogenesis protein CpaD/CtpE